MKITKASIKQLVAESIGDIFSENATISENADNDRVIEEIAAAALLTIMNFNDFELERLIPDAGDRAEFTNGIKYEIKGALKRFSELPPLDRRLPPLERLDEGNEEMAEAARTLEEAAKLLVRGKVLESLHRQDKSELYRRANDLFNELLNLRDEIRNND
tara:strand:+ start:84 stop:563 length:480 start_codon:yes stop_codon:yes gene_type:complete